MYTTSVTLLERFHGGADGAAWREFDARYGELILRYARRCGLQHSDADDVRQMVMVKLTRALPEFQYAAGRGRFRSFLGRIVRNEIARYFGSPSGAPLRVDIRGVNATREADDEQPDDRWDREWIDHHLRLAMQQVRRSCEPRSIEVFERLLAGDSIDAVASAFRMTAQGVHKIKQRMRDRLKGLVAAQIDEEDRTDGPHARPPRDV